MFHKNTVLDTFCGFEVFPQITASIQHDIILPSTYLMIYSIYPAYYTLGTSSMKPLHGIISYCTCILV